MVKIKMSHFFVFPIGSEILTSAQLALIQDILNGFSLFVSKTRRFNFWV